MLDKLIFSHTSFIQWEAVVPDVRTRYEKICDSHQKAVEKYFRLGIQAEREPLPHSRLCIGKPIPIESVTSITTTRNSVTLRWKDPDRGESEIERYIIRRYQGFFGDDRAVGRISETHFTNCGLEPDTKYIYRIIPSNMIGDADADVSFDARTQ